MKEFKLQGRGGQYVKRSIEDQWPRFTVGAPDYDPNDYIKKTEIESDTFLKDKCPPVPDMKDYVLKQLSHQFNNVRLICPKVKVTLSWVKCC